ncbi:hypothetical protein EON62_01650, partial [archaeon]
MADAGREDLGDDDFFAFGDDLTEFFGWDTSAPVLTPMRLDTCACEAQLRCPNGTTSRTGAYSVYDCYKTGAEVLRRTVPLPLDHPSVVNHTARPILRDLYDDRGGLPYLYLRGMQQAVITMNLSSVHVNLTYNDHYQLSVYGGCEPCPPRYVCEYANDPPTCSWPELPTQAELGYLCHDCCSCQRKSMPTWLEIQQDTPPYFDNKHGIVTVTITALQDAYLTVVLELLHGLYVTPFDTDFEGVARMYVHQPSRALYTPSDAGDRHMFYTLITQKTFQTLEMPLNLPMSWTRVPGSRTEFQQSFENEVLIDRPPDYRVAYPAYDADVLAARLATANESLASSSAGIHSGSTAARSLRASPAPRLRGSAAARTAGTALLATRRLTSGNNSTEVDATRCRDEPRWPYFETLNECSRRLAAELYCRVGEHQIDCGRRLASAEAASEYGANIRSRGEHVNVSRDAYEKVVQDITWWAAGDVTGGNVNAFEFLGLPYMPFFSNCDGYDSHMQV